MNRFNLDNFPTPKTKLSSGQKAFLVILSLGFVSLIWYCWNQYHKIQQNRLSKKQKEIDGIQKDNDLTEKALTNIGAGNALHLAKQVVQIQKQSMDSQQNTEGVE